MLYTRRASLAFFCVALLMIFVCADLSFAQSKSKRQPPKLKPGVTGKAKAAPEKKTEPVTETKSEAKSGAPAASQQTDDKTVSKQNPASPNPPVKKSKASSASAKAEKPKAVKPVKVDTITATKTERVYNPNARKEALAKKEAEKAKPADVAKEPVKEKPVATELKVAEKAKSAEKAAPKLTAKQIAAAKAAEKRAAAKEAAKIAAEERAAKATAAKEAAAKVAEEKAAAIAVKKKEEKVYDAARAKAARETQAKAKTTATPKVEVKETVAKTKAKKAEQKKVVVEEKVSKAYAPAITAAKIKSDIVGKTIVDVQSEELGDGMTNWQFLGNQWREVEILSTETTGNEMTMDARLSAKKAKANFDGSYDRIRGNARLHYARTGKGWQLKKIENLSLAHGDTNMDDPTLRNVMSRHAPAPGTRLPDAVGTSGPNTVNDLRRTYPQQTTGRVIEPSSTEPRRGDPYPTPNSQDVNRRADVGGYSTEVVMSETFPVSKRQFEAFRFEVKQGGLVKGSFRVLDREGQINAYIITAAEYQKWNATRAASVNYSSTGVDSGGINLPLNPGEYYVVFYNFSPIGTTRTVEAAVRVEYLPRN